MASILYTSKILKKQQSNLPLTPEEQDHLSKFRVYDDPAIYKRIDKITLAGYNASELIEGLITLHESGANVEALLSNTVKATIVARQEMDAAFAKSIGIAPSTRQL